MNAQQQQQVTDSRPHIYTDFVARLEFRRRVNELKELAAQEGLRLPMPAEWIAALEALGCVVDLHTGAWMAVAGARCWPTEAAIAEVQQKGGDE